jgi:hypothetical protein
MGSFLPGGIAGIVHLRRCLLLGVMFVMALMALGIGIARIGHFEVHGCLYCTYWYLAAM